MIWNYRVMFFDGDEPHYAIHEVYYDKDGKPNMFMGSEADVIWSDDPAAGKNILAMMQEAFTKPVLTLADFGVPHE